MNSDQSNKKQITAVQTLDHIFLGGNKIIFSSNLQDVKRIDFNPCSIKDDGSDLERITFFNGFDGFPMFSQKGKYIVFASNRNKKKEAE